MNGAPLPRLPSRKAQWLLALLTLRAGRDVERTWLVGMLWPDSPETAALANLRSILKDLRRALGSEAGRLCSSTPHTLTLDLAGCEADVVAFDEAIAQAGRDPGGGCPALERAVFLYRAPLLEGCPEPWAFEERQHREQSYLAALERLASQALAAGRPESAERHLRRAVAVDPLRESAQRALMQALAAGGNYAAALLAYQELRQLLHRALNAEPDPETKALFEQIRTEARARGTGSEATLEPVGGAVPLDSPFYVVRPADQEFQQAIARQDSIVLVKGARQVGKTSLLGRGLHQARQSGARVARTDFQLLSPAHLETADALFQRLGDEIADQLELEVGPEGVWDPRRGAGGNFTRYWQRVVLRTLDAPIVWALDEVDRLFTCCFASEVFGLFRAWHNDRVLDPDGPWRRLTLAIAYATEAHLFVTDIHQSPFNVGTRLTLEDFTLDEVGDLNGRYGSPLSTETELARFVRLVGGHPYLVRRGLHEMVAHGIDLAALEAQAYRDDGTFGDHLRRMLVALLRDTDLCRTMREILLGNSCPSLDGFYRLRTAGLIAGDSPEDARPRCQLYATYLDRHLP